MSKNFPILVADDGSEDGEIGSKDLVDTFSGLVDEDGAEDLSWHPSWHVVFNELAESHLPSLGSIACVCKRFRDACWNSIIGFGHTKTVHECDGVRHHRQIRSIVRQCKNLAKVNAGIWTRPFAELGTVLRPTGQLASSVKAVAFSMTSYRPPDSLAEFVRVLPKLSRLALIDCRRLTDKMIRVDLFGAAPFLEALSVAHCPLVSLAALTCRPQHLRALDISHCPKCIGTVGSQSITIDQLVPQLTSLRAVRVGTLVAANLEHIARLTSLVELAIGPPSESLEVLPFFTQIGRQMTNLHRLCLRSKDSSIVPGLNQLSRLRRLRVVSIPLITREELTLQLLRPLQTALGGAFHLQFKENIAWTSSNDLIFQ